MQFQNEPPIGRVTQQTKQKPPLPEEKERPSQGNRQAGTAGAIY
jgi:hypothetical protein